MNRNGRPDGFVKQVKNRITDNEAVTIDVAREIADQLRHELPNSPEEREELLEDIEGKIRTGARQGIRLQTAQGQTLQPIGARGTIPAEQLHYTDQDLAFITTDFKEDPECQFAIEVQALLDRNEAEQLLSYDEPVQFDELSSGDTFDDPEGDVTSVVAVGESTCLVRFWLAPRGPVAESMLKAAQDDPR